MTLERLNPGPRMSQAICIGDIAFLAGQVPDDLDADIGEQTRQVLAKIDAVVEGLGLDQGGHRLGAGLAERHGGFSVHERGLGCLGGAWRAARPRDGRRGAGPARDEGRDDRRGGARADRLRPGDAHPSRLDRAPEHRGWAVRSRSANGWRAGGDRASGIARPG